MNHDFVLSRERMLRLEDLGIDISKANMCWVYDLTRSLERKWCLRVYTDHLRKTAEEVNDRGLYVPTFTMSELIAALPKQVYVRNGQRILTIDYRNDEVGYFGYDTKLCECNTIGADDCDYNEPLMDKLYSLLCWAAQKGLLDGS